jgi:hypothetical protein
MDQYAELMQRLLEIQSGGRERSPELIAEDQRLIDSQRQRTLVGSIDQQAWDLAKVAMNGKNPSMSALALRAQSIKEAMFSGELTEQAAGPRQYGRSAA